MLELHQQLGEDGQMSLRLVLQHLQQLLQLLDLLRMVQVPTPETLNEFILDNISKPVECQKWGLGQTQEGLASLL